MIRFLVTEARIPVHRDHLDLACRFQELEVVKLLVTPAPELDRYRGLTIALERGAGAIARFLIFPEGMPVLD